MTLQLCSFLITISFFSFSYALGAEIKSWFEKANSFYEQQNYDSAVAYYEKIISAGINNADVFYNLGNTYYRKGKIGMAILFFEKAHVLSPHDADIIANLRFANANIVDKIELPDQGFFEFIISRLHALVPLSVQMWIVFLLLLLLSMVFWGILFTKGIRRLWLIYIFCIIVLFTFPIGLSAAVKIYHAEKITYGIILDKSVDAKNEPNGNKVLFTIHEGTKFRISKELQGWLLITLANGVSGWVPSTVIGRI